MNIYLLGTCTLVTLLVSAAVFATPLVYIAVGSAHEVAVVDADSDTVISKYGGPGDPHGVALTPNGNYLLIGSSPSDHDGRTDGVEPRSGLVVMQRNTGVIEGEIPMMSWSHDQVVTPDSRYVVSTHPANGKICIIDLVSRSIIKELELGSIPNHALLSNDGKYIYVSNGGDNAIVEIEVGSWKITRKLHGGDTPGQMAMSKDGAYIYVASYRTEIVSAISVATGKVRNTCKIGKGMQGIDVSDDGKTLYVAYSSGNRLVAMNIRTKERRELKLPAAPHHIKVINSAGKIYVSSKDSPVIWVVDEVSMERLADLKLPGIGQHIALKED